MTDRHPPKTFEEAAERAKAWLEAGTESEPEPDPGQPKTIEEATEAFKALLEAEAETHPEPP